MKVARILLDEPLPLEKSWCWRDDWVHGFDSVYALLSKFAMLNALNAVELAQLFIRRDCGKKTAIVRSPAVDLRYSALFDLTQLARLLRLETPQIHQAFLPEQLANGRRRFRDILCWCPECARSGFHSSAFQLEFVRSCPVHGNPIRMCCQTCGTAIPYQLQVAVFAQPFGCPTCHADLAPAFRNPKDRLLAALPPMTSWISDLAVLCAFDDLTMPIRQDINRQRSRAGLATVLFAISNWRRPASDYSAFIDSVWHVVERKQGNAHLSGPRVPLVVASKGLSELPIRCKLQRATRRLPGIRRTKVSMSATKDAWDEQLRLSNLVYGAVRRHLWRHLLKQHQSCITSAAKHLDWRLEGVSTAAICPVAEAFLRWRMHWEGVGTPSGLRAPQMTMPSGLAGWIGTHAPICPLCWTRTAEQWVSDHVLGRHAIATFRTFLESALAHQRGGRITWHSVIVSTHHLPYWAIVGRDTAADPVTLFSEYGCASVLLALIQEMPKTVEHQQRHLNALYGIQRTATEGS
ncbi:hypothetical protein RY831_02795 [Noviherbaspirillum sp. CPCC 100848]|uniref:TniQ protein n=1 Tax=Noviherbaspirillum album TaxID=3080276 RepID=A0ABU6J4C8_9BURK|nr:hypothetical protein [Noviherbaspirillum sp. CPCC 100848]MEC4718064.1 hypothetical protein [Noviherbaspirillum sp. CPCC 100848]